MRQAKASKGKKKVMGYAEAHNRAVNFYKKSSRFLFWAGLLGVFAALIGVLQLVFGKNFVNDNIVYTWPTSGFALGFSLEIFLSRVFIENIPNPVIYDILIMLIAILLGAGFATLGLFASKGKVVFLYIGGGLYLADFGALYFVYKFLAPVYTWTNYAFTIATHVIVLAALIVAVIEYYRVLDIEKRYHGKKETNLNEEVESEVIAHGQ